MKSNPRVSTRSERHAGRTSTFGVLAVRSSAPCHPLLPASLQSSSQRARERPSLMEAGNEEGEAPLRRPSDVAAPRPKRPTPDHPPYAEMVRVALRELAEEGGSSEASISRYIQSNYAQLPPGHSRLLPYYLGKFVAAGDVSMLSPNRFALPSTPAPPLLILPHYYPIPIPNHHPNPNPNPNPNPLRSSFRQKNTVPQIPRRRRRPPKRKRAATSGSTVGGLMLPPCPASPHHVMDSSASPPLPLPPPRRGRGRPRKNPVTKAPSPSQPESVGEPVPRPRLIIRLRSKPPNPIPDTVAAASEMTTVQVMGKCNECDAGNVYGSDAAQRNPDEKSLPANAYIDEESSLLSTAQSEPETDEALLPLVLVGLEPDVEMLHMDHMQPEPEGGLLLLQPESEFLLRAEERPDNNADQSLPTSVKPGIKKDQSVLAAVRPKSIEVPLPPAIRVNSESLLLASEHLEPEPSEEPLASAQLHMEVKQLKEESSSSSTIKPKSDESILLQVSAYSEPCKELLLLDPMRPKLEEELLQLLPLQSETELELLPLPGPEQSELHEEPMLSISPQTGPEEQLLLPALSGMELIEISSQLAPEQPESIEETLLQPAELDEEYLPPAQLLSEPKEEPFLLPSIHIEPKEEFWSLASIEPEVKEESSPPGPIPAAEKSEKSGHSSKHRRTHAKHRRLWFEC